MFTCNVYICKKLYIHNCNIHVTHISRGKCEFCKSFYFMQLSLTRTEQRQKVFCIRYIKIDRNHISYCFHISGKRPIFRNPRHFSRKSLRLQNRYRYQRTVFCILITISVAKNLQKLFLISYSKNFLSTTLFVKNAIFSEILKKKIWFLKIFGKKSNYPKIPL